MKYRCWDNEYPEEGCSTATTLAQMLEVLEAWMNESDGECSFTVEKISDEEYDKIKEES